ncbi:hypothetical protein XHV734_3774 [Xanthomonas hortorum pv. vitians]|nr:hypothetical protein XHV734_3774 [Xanthomonas hortorum pv. vitians]
MLQGCRERKSVVMPQRTFNRLKPNRLKPTRRLSQPIVQAIADALCPGSKVNR